MKTRFLLLILVGSLAAPLPLTASPTPKARSKPAVKTEASSPSKATEFARIAGTYSGSIIAPDHPNHALFLRLAEQKKIVSTEITVTLIGSAHAPKLGWGKQITPLRRTGAGTFIFDDRSGKFGRAYGSCIIRNGIMRLEYTSEHKGKSSVTSLTLRKR